jgi:probable phosphoglycerate mutase
MTVLLLIRHGDNDALQKKILYGDMPGIHLNERGHAQAAALAEALRSAPLKAIYSSPLERAVETAQPLADLTGLPIRVVPELSDPAIGEWTARPLKELRRLPAWKVVQKTPSRFRFPGGESFPEVQARIVNALEAISQAHRKNDRVAVVFHADPIKLAVAHYLGMPLDHFQRLGIATGSLSVLVMFKDIAQLTALNLRPPFELPG